MFLFRRVVPFLTAALFASSLGRKSQLGLTCGNTGACDEFEVELAEEELAAEMQVELLQRMPMDIRLASEGVANATSQKLCLLDHLVGSWHVQNALGIDGVTVLLHVSDRPSKDCHQVKGQIHYLGKQTEYQISAMPLDTGKLYVKFMNDKAEPAYFHEGEYDMAKDVLFEDLDRCENTHKSPLGAMVANMKEDNPFKLPSDDKIFAMREEERQRRAEERERVKHQHVWEKVTAACRHSRTRRIDDIDDAQASAARPDARLVEGLGRDARRDKENISDFVAKKREMFLVQMSLDVKKAEILKLDARAKDKEEALNKSKQMLDKDVERFDAFLSTNDDRAHDAMQKADTKAREKQERVIKIKQLKSQLSAIQSEIAKHKEQKDECLRYKDFLVNLTPAEWKEQKREEKKQRKLQRRKIAVDARMGEIEEKLQAEIEAEELAFREKEEKEKKGRRRQKRTEEDEQKERDQMEARRRRIARKYPVREQVDAEYVEYSSGEEMPLYFQEPKQLLHIFTSLEESNLFLIQNSQDTEQALEELEQKFAVLRKTREAMSNKMQVQISQLERQIFEEKSKCDELKQAISQSHGGSEIEELLDGLAGGVVEVHGVCMHENQDDGDTLQMLARIEFKLEEYLAYLDEAEDSGLGARVLAEEHKKERQRRLDLRLSRKLQQEKKIEDRLKASLQRSQAPVHKKVGKQIMFRSAPLFQARRVVQEDDGYEEAVREHNIFGIWLDKDGVPNAQQPEKAEG